MIVLRKINSFVVEKVIQSGDTETFFELDPVECDAFDLKLKITSEDRNGIVKATSLFSNDSIEITNYAFLGDRFKTVNKLYKDGALGILEITNNEDESIRCVIKVTPF